MEFKSPIQQQVFEKTVKWTRELFGEMAVVRDDAPFVGIGYGSAWIQVAVFPWRDDEAVICVRSWVVTGIEHKEDLLKYLLQKNANMRFGGFGLDDDGDICFEHSICGSTADKNELKASIMAVAQTADYLDDEIVARWGGQRAIDRR